MMSTTNKRRRGSAKTAALAGATLLAALTMAGSASAQEIVVTGNSRVDAETIRSYVTGTASGSLEEARRNLLSTGMFDGLTLCSEVRPLEALIDSLEDMSRGVGSKYILQP